MIQNRSNLNQDNFMIPSSKKFRIANSCTCTLINTVPLTGGWSEYQYVRQNKKSSNVTKLPALFLPPAGG